MWPVLIVALLGLNIAVVAVTVIAATSDPSVAVEPDYYQKALTWDEERGERRDPTEDGLEVAVQLQPSPDRLTRGQVVVAVTNQSERVEHAQIDAEVFHYARSGERQSLKLDELQPGVYVAAADLRRNGNWEVRLRMMVNGQTYLFTRPTEMYGATP